MTRSRIAIIELFFLLIVVGLSYGFFVVMQPFILNVFLAAVFSAVLYPVYERVTRRVGGRRALSSVLMVLLVFVVVTLPVTFIGILVYFEAVAGYTAVADRMPVIAERLGGVSLLAWARDLPVIGRYVDQLEGFQLSEVLREAVLQGSNFIVQAAQQSFVSVGTALAGFLLVLMLMFFFFLSGPKFLAKVYAIIPLPYRALREMTEETRRTATATLISTLLIGLIEGAYGAVLFLIFGLPSPFLWGLIIMVLSMIPLIGTNLVLVPAGIILIATGRIFSGIAIIALGLGGVAFSQNVLRPKLLGDRSGLHPALALLSTIGGIIWLGLIGFLVGPLIASLFIVIWQQFARRYRQELAERDAEESIASGSR